MKTIVLIFVLFIGSFSFGQVIPPKEPTVDMTALKTVIENAYYKKYVEQRSTNYWPESYNTNAIVPQPTGGTYSYPVQTTSSNQQVINNVQVNNYSRPQSTYNIAEEYRKNAQQVIEYKAYLKSQSNGW